MRAPAAGRNIAVFDLDGTLSDDGWRCDEHHPWDFDGDEAARRWELYYAGIELDEPNRPLFEMARALRAAGFELAIATARPHRYRQPTLRWLDRWRWPDINLRVVMRADGDERHTAEVKTAMARMAIGIERIALWVDDHPGIGPALHPLGIPVLTLENTAAQWHKETK